MSLLLLYRVFSLFPSHPFLRAKYSRLSRYTSEHVLFSPPPPPDSAQSFSHVLGDQKILVFERRPGKQNKRLKVNGKIYFISNNTRKVNARV